jgi:mannose-6-phosphate isomerase-like protein (cupin superfamily)
MSEFDPRRIIPLAEALRAVPPDAAQRFATVFRHGSLHVELYAPRGHDGQTPHERDEAYVVTEGRGTFVCDGQRLPFAPGDFLFAPAGAEHRFEDFSDDLTVWVIFYGPAGGEKSPR